MAETIFSVLRGLEHTRLCPYSSGVFRAIISFVESGVCSGSKVDKFIMGNFRLSPTKLTELWNRRFNGNKSASTFRGQISQLSSYICSIFGCTAQELNDAFVTGRVDVLRSIRDIIRVFPYGNVDLSDAFIGQELLPEASLEGDFSVKDCQKELCLLWSLDRYAVQSHIAGVDAGKLSYVLGVLSQPLVTDVYTAATGRKKKTKTARVNREKVQFLKALPRQASHPPMQGTAGQGLDTVMPTEPYKLGISNGLMGMLGDRMQEYENLPEEMKQGIMAQSDGKSRKAAEKFLRFFTAGVFGECLDSLNAYDLYMALEKYKT